jgi:saccharopine dehydrogenase (NAD+, L-lysine-forming)
MTTEGSRQGAASAGDSSADAIVVYGATGHTGAQLCATLIRGGAKVVMVGRDRRKLDLLARESNGHAELFVAAIDDAVSLRAAVAKGRVVVNCAGPFARYGRAVQDAALANGRHCLDMSGEPGFVQATLARDAEARERGALLVSGIGFDVVPTDALAALLAQAVGGQVTTARVAYSRLDAGPTAGLGMTMLQGLLDGGSAFVDGSLRREALGHDRWNVRFPGASGSVSCLSVPWGDVISLPHSTGARTARAYLPKTMPPPALGSALMRALRWALPAHLFPKLEAFIARRMVRRLPLSTNDRDGAPGGSGARLSAVVELTGNQGTKVGWVVAGSGITIHAAALCARATLAPGFGARGARTPSQAFGARELLEGLARYGLEWRILS